jgi:hypothetical protein
MHSFYSVLAKKQQESRSGSSINDTAALGLGEATSLDLNIPRDKFASWKESSAPCSVLDCRPGNISWFTALLTAFE